MHGSHLLHRSTPLPQHPSLDPTAFKMDHVREHVTFQVQLLLSQLATSHFVILMDEVGHDHAQARV